eukprot:765094-Hanusia_phi.AAC.2
MRLKLLLGRAEQQSPQKRVEHELEGGSGPVRRAATWAESLARSLLYEPLVLCTTPWHLAKSPITVPCHAHGDSLVMLVERAIVFSAVLSSIRSRRLKNTWVSMLPCR